MQQDNLYATLPITNNSEPCMLDREDIKWFQDKQLYLDDEGVYYRLINNPKKYYVHTQVYAIAVKNGSKNKPKRFNNFVRLNCDPHIQQYYFN